MGKFINGDPIRSGINWYSYCGGNPVAFIDSSGLAYGNNKRIQNLVELVADWVSLGNITTAIKGGKDIAD